MFFNEQSDTPGENLTSVQPESSVETQPSVESQQTSSTTRGEGGGRRLRGGFFFEGGEGGGLSLTRTLIALKLIKIF